IFAIFSFRSTFAQNASLHAGYTTPESGYTSRRDQPACCTTGSAKVSATASHWSGLAAPRQCARGQRGVVKGTPTLRDEHVVSRHSSYRAKHQREHVPIDVRHEAGRRPDTTLLGQGRKHPRQNHDIGKQGEREACQSANGAKKCRRHFALAWSEAIYGTLSVLAENCQMNNGLGRSRISLRSIRATGQCLTPRQGPDTRAGATSRHAARPAPRR